MLQAIKRLNGEAKNYEWGKIGDHSEVALLMVAGQANAKIEKMPYAELWVGTHPDGLAKIHSTNVTLFEYINGHKKTKHNLPFIMKIMSINHTLSLQVHPTKFENYVKSIKEQAEVLHKNDPFNYRDPNHKLELAYALSKFELLCGFRPIKELIFNMKSFPELRFAMGVDNCAEFIASEKHNNFSEPSQLLKKCFSCMMKHDQMYVHSLLSSLMNRIKNGEHGCLRKETVEVLLNLNKMFPNDIACICPLLMNHIILQPGECVFYGAQELHAYLSGECVECVSCSNNTIRAGLTSKFVDRDNLLNVLNYRMADPASYYVWPRQPKGFPHIHEFVPDCDDFILQCLRIDTRDMLPLDLPALECPSIFIIIEAENATCVEMDQNGPIIGKQFHVNRGDIFFIPSFRIMRFLFLKSVVRGYRTYSFELGPDFTKRMEPMDTINEFLEKRPRA